MFEKVERTLAGLLAGARPAVLFDAMRHAVMGGGKRIRPRLCLAAAAVLGFGSQRMSHRTSASFFVRSKVQRTLPPLSFFVFGIVSTSFGAL